MAYVSNAHRRVVTSLEAWAEQAPSARPAAELATSAEIAASPAASTGARSTDRPNEIPIVPAEPGAPLPATSFPGGFRTPALGARGCVSAGPASETRHKGRHLPHILGELGVRRLYGKLEKPRVRLPRILPHSQKSCRS